MGLSAITWLVMVRKTQENNKDNKKKIQDYNRELGFLFRKLGLLRE